MNNTTTPEVALQNMGAKMISIFRGRLAEKNKNASGETSKSLELQIPDLGENNYGVDIYGNPSWRWIDEGRKTTKPGTPKGDPSLKDVILKWMQVRGIVATDISQESLAYLIARKIHREGYPATMIFTDGIREFLQGDNFGELTAAIANKLLQMPDKIEL